MNGYGSKRNPNSATMLIVIQRITNTVMYPMNRAVPMNRANASAKCPNVSPDSRGSRTRRGSLGWSSRTCRRGSATGAPYRQRLLVPVAPVPGQEVVEYVVDGDRADQPVVLVDHG